MKTVFKKSIAALLFASSLTLQLCAATQTNTATPVVEASQPEKTKLQSLGNLSAAMVRGALRGFASGMASSQIFKNEHCMNVEELSDFAAELLPIPALTDAMFVSIDDTQTARIVEQITASFAHAACFMEKSNHGIDTFFMHSINRLIKGLNVRNASKVTYWCTMIARFITESINNHCFIQGGSFSEKFRPLVGLAAVARTHWVEKIIDNRIATGIITEEKANRTRTILNAFIGLPLSFVANCMNLFIASKIA